jgi:hypothetical protein
MSSIAVTASATGTGVVSLVAPVTNTNRTLTLPDATGTVLVSGNGISGTTGTFSGDLSFNSGYGSAAVGYGCRAWVNFNGTGTVAIRASGNVSSITDNGTGDYTVNFTTAMPDTNYCATISSNNIASNSSVSNNNNYRAPATANFSFAHLENATLTDTSFLHIAIFR